MATLALAIGGHMHAAPVLASLELVKWGSKTPACMLTCASTVSKSRSIEFGTSRRTSGASFARRVPSNASPIIHTTTAAAARDRRQPCPAKAGIRKAATNLSSSAAWSRSAHQSDGAQAVKELTRAAQAMTKCRVPHWQLRQYCRFEHGPSRCRRKSRR